MYSPWNFHIPVNLRNMIYSTGLFAFSDMSLLCQPNRRPQPPSPPSFLPLSGAARARDGVAPPAQGWLQALRATLRAQESATSCDVEVEALNGTRSSSREVRIGYPFSVVYFSRGTLPPKTGKRAPLGDVGEVKPQKVNFPFNFLPFF